MATRIELSAQPRDKSVKPQVLRRRDTVPAIMYGHDFAPRELQFDFLATQRVVQQAGTSQLVNITVQGEGDEHMVLIREVQRDPVTDSIIHLDLYRLVAGEVVTTEIPIIQRGVAPVIESMGGIVNQLIDTVEIECLPKDIPQALEIDVASLVDFDSFLTLADLQVPEGVQILVPMDTEVVRVLAPRSEEELEEAATVSVEEVEMEAEEIEGEVEEALAEAEEGAAPEGEAEGE